MNVQTGAILITVFCAGSIVAYFGMALIDPQLVNSMSQHVSSAQTASATTDYFSWSCQELQNEINHDIDQERGIYPLGSVMNVGMQAWNLIQIMQLKGCSVSP